MQRDYRSRVSPNLQRKRAFLWAILIILALGIALRVPARRGIYAFRLMLALKGLAEGATADDLQVTQERIRRKHGGVEFDALLYRPAGRAPGQAIVLIAGISELGCYHPRLMALCRALADKGFLVMTPDIRMFRSFQIAPEAMDEIAFWFEQLRTFPDANHVRRVGLGGISFSGTLALITAVRPEIRDGVAYVLAIGPYDDPLRCSRGWFAAGPITVSPGYYPTRFYARWIIMRAALDMLPGEDERRFLTEVLGDLLLQKQPPAALPTLSQEASRWYRLAIMRENESDPQLAQRIEGHIASRLYSRITPDRAAAEVRCPVFLVHGAYDDLIPPEESLALRARITQARSYLLVSPFLTHTHPFSEPLRWGDRVRGVMDIFGFFYSFARVV